MELNKIERREDYLLVTLAGQVSFSEATVVLIKIRDVATETGFDKVLVDCLSLSGELSSFERYKLGQILAQHWQKGLSGTPKIAIVGTPPTIRIRGAGGLESWLPCQDVFGATQSTGLAEPNRFKNEQKNKNSRVMVWILLSLLVRRDEQT